MEALERSVRGSLGPRDPFTRLVLSPRTSFPRTHKDVDSVKIAVSALSFPCRFGRPWLCLQVRLGKDLGPPSAQAHFTPGLQADVFQVWAAVLGLSGLRNNLRPWLTGAGDGAELPPSERDRLCPIRTQGESNWCPRLAVKPMKQRPWQVEGLWAYLEPSARLGDYAYVHEAIALGKDIHLVLAKLPPPVLSQPPLSSTPHPKRVAGEGSSHPRRRPGPLSCPAAGTSGEHSGAAER